MDMGSRESTEGVKHPKLRDDVPKKTAALLDFVQMRGMKYSAFI